MSSEADAEAKNDSDDHRPTPLTIQSPAATPAATKEMMGDGQKRRNSLPLQHHHVITPPSTTGTGITGPRTPFNASPLHHTTYHHHSVQCQCRYNASQLLAMSPEQRWVPLSIDVTTPAQPLESSIHALLASLYFPFFDHHIVPPLSALRLIPVSGGVTNTLYRAVISGDNGSKTSILIRIYGANSEAVIDRVTECRLVNTLSQSGFGVGIFGHFLNGRLEQWLDASPLTPMLMLAGEHSVNIARTLAVMHSQSHQSLSFLDHPQAASLALTPYHRIMPEWCQLIEQYDFDDSAFWQSELSQSLALLVDSHYQCSPLVFSHSDLLSGNILRSDSGEYYFIDYEYSSFHYAAFDIANHFCECCGFEMNWAQFPDRPWQLTFLRNYLTQLRTTDSDTGYVADSVVEKFHREVEAHLIFSHLFWGIWALIQTKHSAIDFDYLTYSKLRKQGYLKHRERSWALLTDAQ